MRRRSTIITSTGHLTRPDIRGLRGHLESPIPPDTAIIIPLSGKKIVAPRARWGMLATDSCVITWTARLHRLMGYAVALREMGFSEPALRQDSPAYPVLLTLPYTDHDHVQRMWADLAVIRHDKTLLPLFLFLARKMSL